ncbi:MAG: hypothetical protein ACR2GB_00495 [Nocardioidaceae bacterium]
MTAADWGVLTSTFAASFVECVEALTIVLAMGITRGWRSVVAGVLTAVAALIAFTALAGYALATWLQPAALQLVVGALMLIFGLQWLRKAVLRSAGLKAMHDEVSLYVEQTNAGRSVTSQQIFGLDAFGFIVSMKAVFLEGVEVTFIVVTFGLNADNLPLATVGGVAAAAIVAGLGVWLHRPLASIPENALKYAVGLVLTAFGTFWSLEGLGILTDSRQSLEWPGGDWALLGLLALWAGSTRLLVWLLTSRSGVGPQPPHRREYAA